MRILAALGDAKERQRIAAFLTAAHHDVVENASPSAALADAAFDVAFVEVGHVGHARHAPHRIYVIAVVPVHAASSDYWAAYMAGADDVMRATAPRDEILGRANALARIRTWAGPPLTLAQRLAALPLWTRIEDIVAAELGQLVGEPFAVSCSTAPADLEIAVASTVTLALTSEQIMIRLGFTLDPTSAAALQATLLGGDTAPEAIADAMRELANTAAGAIARSAVCSGTELTIGLPSNSAVVASSAFPAARPWTLRTASGTTLACVAFAGSSAPKVVHARDLREGMVLARDVRNAMGVLVAPAGTNITRTTVEQLSRILGAAANLEINEIAA